MKQLIFNYIKKHGDMFLHILSVTTLFIIGILFILRAYHYSFASGDISLFYSFAKNILDGEIIYKDFIHFRTPGSYYLMASFLKIFGDNMHVLWNELAFEAIIFYPIALYVFSFCVSRIKIIAFASALMLILI